MDIKKIIESDALYAKEHADIFMDVLILQFKLVRTVIMDPRFTPDNDEHEVVPDKILLQNFIASWFPVARYLYTHKASFGSIKAIADRYFDVKSVLSPDSNLENKALFNVYADGENFDNFDRLDSKTDYIHNTHGILTFHYLTSLTEHSSDKSQLNELFKLQLPVIHLMNKAITEFNWRVPFNAVLGYDKISTIVVNYLLASQRTYAELSHYIESQMTEDNIQSYYYS